MSARTVVNPWSWQETQGWTWGIDVEHPTSILHTAGQVAVDASGAVVAPGDLRGQVVAALDNLEVVLAAAGYELADVVRIDYYTTDPDGMVANWDVVSDRLVPAGCRAGGVLLGVTRLALPELQIEIQAVAVR